MIIDAGSSGSRAHVYTYLPPHPSPGHSHTHPTTSIHIPAASAHLNSAGAGSHGSRGSGSYGGSYGDGYNGGYARVQLPGSEMRIGPGLSAYAPSGSSAGQSLKPLLEYARQQVRAHTEKGIVADSRCRYTCRSELGQVELRS